MQVIKPQSSKLGEGTVYNHMPRSSFLSRHVPAGKLLNALLSGLSDRSAGVRKGNAKAIGHLVKVTILSTCAY